MLLVQNIIAGGCTERTEHFRENAQCSLSPSSPSMTRPDAAVELDAREIDGEPFDEIMAALGELAADESLRLINSFEPEPLYQVLEQRGFEHRTSNPEPGVWYVHISHK